MSKRKLAISVTGLAFLAAIGSTYADTHQPPTDPSKPTVCISSSERNSGVCKRRADGLGDACVKMFSISKNCYTQVSEY